MDEAVEHKDSQPVYYVRDLFFTRIVVDVLDYDRYGTHLHFTVYYAATSEYLPTYLFIHLGVFVIFAMFKRFFVLFSTDEGRVYKIVQWYNDAGAPGSALLDIFDIMPGLPITAMEISKKVSLRR